MSTEDRTPSHGGTDHERLIRMEANQERALDVLGKIDRTVHGSNGTRGLTTRVALLEQESDDAKEWRASVTRWVVGSVMTALTAWAGAFWGLLKR